MGVAGENEVHTGWGSLFKKVETLGESWDVKRWDVNVETTKRDNPQIPWNFRWKW